MTPAVSASASSAGVTPEELQAARSVGINPFANQAGTGPLYPEGQDVRSSTSRLGTPTSPTVDGPIPTVNSQPSDPGIQPQHLVYRTTTAFPPSQSGKTIGAQGLFSCPVSVIPGIRVCVQVTGSGIYSTINSTCNPSPTSFTYNPLDSRVSASASKGSCVTNLLYRGVVRGSTIHGEGVFDGPPEYSVPKRCA